MTKEKSDLSPPSETHQVKRDTSGNVIWNNVATNASTVTTAVTGTFTSLTATYNGSMLYQNIKASVTGNTVDMTALVNGTQIGTTTAATAAGKYTIAGSQTITGTNTFTFRASFTGTGTLTVKNLSVSRESRTTINQR